MEELRPLEDLQRVVWGVDDVEVVPASAMRASVHAGGLVVAAMVDGAAVGFVYGFPATPHGRGMEGPGLHSHMAAVLPGMRSAGVGRRMKRYQADWCRRRGLEWISWTFDPLRPGNARFNLEVLGARCYDYLSDFYGPMPGTLGGGLPSDRLLAVWRLAGGGTPGGSVVGPQAGQLGAGEAQGRAARGVWLLPPGDEPNPLGDDALRSAVAAGAPLSVAVPAAALDVFSRPELALRWRSAHRATLGRALDLGYMVVGFGADAFALEPGPGRTAKTDLHKL